MDKKVKLKLIFYIIGVILPLVGYWLFVPLTKPLKDCWDGSCPTPVIDSTKLLIICIIISLIFTFLAIRTIIINKKK